MVTGNDDAQLEPIYEEIPEQRSITMLPPSAIESNRSSELGMEYDDVETILLGKLSAKDLEGVVDIDPEGEEEFTPLQFEVEVDVEPVREQPLYVNIQADKELSPKVKKRRKSSLRHHSKRESSHYSHHHHHHHSHHNRHKKNTITGEGEPRAGEQGHNRISPSLTHDKQSQPTYQMGVASPAKPLPPPPSFAPPPPPLPSLSIQRAPPNVPLLIDFTDSPLEDPTPKQ